MHHEPQATAVGGATSWLTLGVFIAFAMLAGALLFMPPSETQLALSHSPLPFDHVTPPITQPTAP